MNALLLVTLLAPLTAHAGTPLPKAKSSLFSASGNCAMCHTGRENAEGEPVSPDTTWQATIMAQAARDPYWEATVRHEVMLFPDLSGVIEDKCSLCHTPMATAEEHTEGKTSTLLDDGFLDKDHHLHEIAEDSISCTFCHQVTDEDLGQTETFSGHYHYDTTTPMGARPVYGPSRIDDDMRTMMQTVTGFQSVQGEHLSDAGFCATCHVLFTPWVDEDGKVGGEFAEQTTFLEWRTSDYAGSKDCQECHMPVSDWNGQPYSVHRFRGGNAWMIDMLAAGAEELDIPATPDEFAVTAADTREHLATSAATLSIDEASLTGTTLSATLHITALTGHKLPSGYPSRRVWLHTVITDAKGKVVFESGAPQDDGSIAGNANDEDGSAFEPHYQTITAADQVQIYEPILGTNKGEVTTILLRAAQYLKDNRLLPAGLERHELSDDIGVYGTAIDDVDFAAGGDVVRYQVDLGKFKAPLTVEARLLYQAAGARWITNLEEVDSDESRRFAALGERVPNTAEVLATAEVEVR